MSLLFWWGCYVLCVVIIFFFYRKFSNDIQMVAPYLVLETDKISAQISFSLQQQLISPQFSTLAEVMTAKSKYYFDATPHTMIDRYTRYQWLHEDISYLSNYLKQPLWTDIKRSEIDSGYRLYLRITRYRYLSKIFLLVMTYGLGYVVL